MAVGGRDVLVRTSRSPRLMLVAALVACACVLAVVSAVRTAPPLFGRIDLPSTVSAERGLVVPPQVGEWRLRPGLAEKLGMGGPEALTHLRDQRAIEGDAVWAVYKRPGGGRVRFLGAFVGPALEGTSPGTAARDLLAGAAGDTQPVEMHSGRMGGGLACTDGVDGFPQVSAACVWIDTDTLGFLLVEVPGMSTDDAATLALEVREAATVS